MARESNLDYELAKQLGMTVDEVREQGLGAALDDFKADIGRLYSTDEVEAYVMSTHVAIFGGSFDPPTVGHIAFAQFLLQHFDQVWIVPCPTRHLFRDKDMSAASVRLEMCRLAFGEVEVPRDEVSSYPGEEGKPNVTIRSSFPGKVTVSDYEIYHGLSGAAIDFVTSLLADPVAEPYTFHYAIGMDNANNIHEWVEFEKLLKLIPFVVVPRVGHEIDVTVDWYEKPPHRLLVPSDPLPETASSDVRAIIKNQGFVWDDNFDRLSELIIDPIFDFIRAESLYVS